MKETSVYFRIFFVMLAASATLTSVTIMLMYFYKLFPHIENISETSEKMPSTRNSIFAAEPHAYNPYVKPLAGKSPFSDRKLYINKNTDYKTILWWNTPSWLRSARWHTDFRKCNYKNCKVSFDRKYVNKSNAIVFSLDITKLNHTPPVPMDKRNPDQAWIFFTFEPPSKIKLPSPQWHNTFNWSWNYRPDSDIFSPYGRLYAKEILPIRNYSEIFRRKTKQIAWLVSHCNAESARDDFVRILKKYIPVDIFGKCGKQPPDNVVKFISENYKFYLGFENSLCFNYVTEKFFGKYKLDLINVVRGKTNYSAYFPAHSYINTADFSSIKALGEFLQALSKDEKEYIKYLKIKDMFEVKQDDMVREDAVCNICDKINNLEDNRKTYTNIGEWFGKCDRANDLNET